MEAGISWSRQLSLCPLRWWTLRVLLFPKWSQPFLFDFLRWMHRSDFPVHFARWESLIILSVVRGRSGRQRACLFLWKLHHGQITVWIVMQFEILRQQAYRRILQLVCKNRRCIEHHHRFDFDDRWSWYEGWFPLFSLGLKWHRVPICRLFDASRPVS